MSMNHGDGDEAPTGRVHLVLAPGWRWVLRLPAAEGGEVAATVHLTTPEMNGHFPWLLTLDRLLEFARELRTAHDAYDAVATLADGLGAAHLAIGPANPHSDQVLISGEFSVGTPAGGELRLALRRMFVSRGQLPLALSELTGYLARYRAR